MRKIRDIILDIVIIFGIFTFPFLSTDVIMAGERKDKVRKIIINKEVRGKVGGITPTLITIIYKEDKRSATEYEIDLPIDEDIELKHITRLSEIRRGDIVRVKYDVTIKEYDDVDSDGTVKHKSKVLGRKAKVITFIRPKMKGLRSDGRF